MLEKIMGWFGSTDESDELEKSFAENKQILDGFQALNKDFGITVSSDAERDENLNRIRREGSGR